MRLCRKGSANPEGVARGYGAVGKAYVPPGRRDKGGLDSSAETVRRGTEQRRAGDLRLRVTLLTQPRGMSIDEARRARLIAVLPGACASVQASADPPLSLPGCAITQYGECGPK